MSIIRKVLSVLLAILLVTAAIPLASAAERKEPPIGAYDCIAFDANSVGWYGISAVQFYFYDVETGEDLISWGSKRLNGTDDDGDNIWEYNPTEHGMDIRAGRQYAIIFVNRDSMAQTYDLLFDTSCYGDTACCTNFQIENPVDFNKNTVEARWKNSGLGPRLQITFLGNVVGTTCPYGMTPETMLVDFLCDNLYNARIYSGKNDQRLLDDIGAALGFSTENVESAINEAGVYVDWSKTKSSLSSSDSGDSGSEIIHHDSCFSDPDYSSFYLYLTDELPYLRSTSIKPDQYLVDDEARERGLRKGDVEYIFEKGEISGIEWSPAQSKLDKGYLYKTGSYYLIGTDADTTCGIDNVRGYYRFEKDNETGCYTLDLYDVDTYEDYHTYYSEARRQTAAVAQYLGNDRFEIVTREDISIYEPEFFFFRPEEEDYCFGYNDRSEMLIHNSGSASGSGSSGSSAYSLPNPQMKSITCGTDGLILSWDKVTGAAQYAVYVLGENGWSRIAATKLTTFTYTAGTSGNAYTFTLRCLSADGKKFTSDYNRHGWTKRRLDPPGITALGGYEDGVHLTWEPVAGNARYRVYVQYLDSWKALGDTYDTAYVHSSEGEGSIYAHEGETYTYTVRCVSYSGNAVTSAYDPNGKSITYHADYRSRYSVSGTVASSALSGGAPLEPDGNSVFFDANSVGWYGISAVQFYFYDVETGAELIPWGSKRLNGTDNDGDNIWEYDPTEHGMDIRADRQYAIIFVNRDSMAQTYDLLFDTSCCGDTAYCTNCHIENPVDSNKYSIEARWQNSALGPRLQITSLGNVVGETVPSSLSPYGMIVRFLASRGKDGLTNTLNWSWLSIQEQIDATASMLELRRDDVAAAIREAAKPNCYSDDQTDWSGDWSASRSLLAPGSNPQVYVNGGAGSNGVTLELINDKGVTVAAAVVSNPSGEYSFDSVTLGEYTLIASKKNHVTRSYAVTVCDDDVTRDVKLHLIGDVNGDGQITTVDFGRVNAAARGKSKLSGYDLAVADVTDDGQITTADAGKINAAARGKSSLW